MLRQFVSTCLAGAGLVQAALQVDFSSVDSIKAAAALVAADTLNYYQGDQPGHVPGILPGPPPKGDYYWWQGGALWGTMIDYWHATRDANYNPIVMQALLFQAGPDNDYMHANWSAQLGNDDQAFWGMSALLAAETMFPDPAPGDPQWLALAQAVFNDQIAEERRDDTCNGGLRWQIFPNVGYDYKNSIANGCFFNIAARLARYLDNATYAEWANSTWDWVAGVGLIDDKYNIYDGAHIGFNCTDINRAQFSYNAAVYLEGAAFMYNWTNGSPVWTQRLTSLLDATLGIFFPGGIAYEVSCETDDFADVKCNADMLSYKGYLHRWLAVVAQLAPSLTHSKIAPVLRSSAQAAVKQCTGGVSGRECGFHWSSGIFDGRTGAGQQMNVLGALTSVLIVDHGIAPPVTNATGGTSQGDWHAGSRGDGILVYGPVTAADRAGAGVLTALMLIGGLSTWAWMSTSFFEGSFD